MSQVVCFGEAMVRLAPPHSQRIEQARSFDVEVGGAELNTAVGLLIAIPSMVNWKNSCDDCLLKLKSVGLMIRRGVVKLIIASSKYSKE